MISSFWNLCRACPSMPVEKIHSEYRSTFQWHSGSRPPPVGSEQTPVLKEPIKSATFQSPFWQGGEKRPGVAAPVSSRKHYPGLINKGSTEWYPNTQGSREIQRAPSSKNVSSTKGIESSEIVGVPRKSISMGTIRAATAASDNVNVNLNVNENRHMSRSDNTGASMSSLEVRESHRDDTGSTLWNAIDPKVKHDDDMRKNLEPKREEYKSEYKKRFRPFSQYEYVDGRFTKKRDDQEAVTNPWYKEVIELRKKAGEYKYRGWGTELVPQHLAEIYNQQLWDQVSRRSSLAALALITTTTKSVSKDDRDKENIRKSNFGRSQSSRPNTATPKHPISDLNKGKDSDTVHALKKSSTPRRIPKGKARSQSAGPGGRSPRKGGRQLAHGWKHAQQDSISSSGSSHAQTVKGLPRHPRPTTLATSPRPKASSGKSDRDSNSKLAKQLQLNKSSADPDMGYYEPVVKSPPEPTRVKSPDQVIVRSPDPVNWTVPLDTTKSFTVTQNIRDAPPSPRFRAGFHGDTRHHHGQHSSAASTLASSPLSSFSARSAPVPETSAIGANESSSSVVNKGTVHVKGKNGPGDGLKGHEKTHWSPHSTSATTATSAATKAKEANVTTYAASSPAPSAPSSTAPASNSIYSEVNGYKDKESDSISKDKLPTPVSSSKTASSSQKMTTSVRTDKDPVATTSSTSSLTSTDATRSSSKTATSMANTSNKKYVESSKGKPVPGTTLRCLDDPSFSTDLSSSSRSNTMSTKAPASSSAKKSQLPTSTASSSSKATKVEGAKEPVDFVPPPPVSAPKRQIIGSTSSQVSEKAPRKGGYRVLEAPEEPVMTSSISPAAPGRSKATDVLEKARTKFDKFWGKKDNETSN